MIMISLTLRAIYLIHGIIHSGPAYLFFFAWIGRPEASRVVGGVIMGDESGRLLAIPELRSNRPPGMAIGRDGVYALTGDAMFMGAEGAVFITEPSRKGTSINKRNKTNLFSKLLKHPEHIHSVFSDP